MFLEYAGKPFFHSIESQLLTQLYTQLLFGECYQVLSITADQNWVKVFHEDTGFLDGFLRNQSKTFKKLITKVFLTKTIRLSLAG